MPRQTAAQLLPALLLLLLLQGCIECGDVGTALQVFERMQAAGVDANAFTHHQLVDACVVAGAPAPGLRGRLLVQEALLLLRCSACKQRQPWGGGSSKMSGH